MAPKSIAATAVLVCIGILLLSACGLPIGTPARVQPVVLTGNFAVYGPGHTLLATGRLEPTSDIAHLRGSLTLLLPDCLSGRQFQMAGALAPRLKLQAAGQGPHITLESNTAPIYQPYAIRVLPFSGRLVLADSCANQDLPVTVELLPGAPQSVP